MIKHDLLYALESFLYVLTENKDICAKDFTSIVVKFPASEAVQATSESS